MSFLHGKRAEVSEFIAQDDQTLFVQRYITRGDRRKRMPSFSILGAEKSCVVLNLR